MLIMFRILIVVILLAVAAFCTFGFLATFESPAFTRWRIGYGVAFVLCFAGAAWAVLGKSAKL